jgi:serine protease AprX
MESVYSLGLTGKNINVCVLDTGIFYHMDFGNRLVEFVDFTENARKHCYDDSGHGTHVCGILAGNGRASAGKYQGIAPKANLIVGKILDHHGKGRFQELFRGMDWILEHHKHYRIRIVNISIGIPEKENWTENEEKRERLSFYMEQFVRAGILVVTAAGNFGPERNSLSILGESTKTICVGCHDGNVNFPIKKKCEVYSGRGPSIYSMRKPDVVAPGTEIVSCSNRNAGRYVKKSGTSMACPIVSGLAALLLEQYPMSTPEQLIRKIQRGAIDLGEDWSKQGYGMIDGEKLFFQSGRER